MAGHQIDLAFDTADHPATTGSSAPTASSGLRDEIANVWGLPLDDRVEISFRGGQLDVITGKLELVSTPDFPWNPREPLQLRIAGFVFSSRDIASWMKV